MIKNRKIKIAFIKYGGMASAGTERFLQSMALYLPKDCFDIDYFIQATDYDIKNLFLMQKNIMFLR